MRGQMKAPALWRVNRGSVCAEYAIPGTKAAIPRKGAEGKQSRRPAHAKRGGTKPVPHPAGEMLVRLRTGRLGIRVVLGGKEPATSWSDQPPPATQSVQTEAVIQGGATATEPASDVEGAPSSRRSSAGCALAERLAAEIIRGRGMPQARERWRRALGGARPGYAHRTGGAAELGGGADPTTGWGCLGRYAATKHRPRSSLAPATPRHAPDTSYSQLLRCETLLAARAN
jgi:hypothetical protein